MVTQENNAMVCVVWMLQKKENAAFDLGGLGFKFFLMNEELSCLASQVISRLSLVF